MTHPLNLKSALLLLPLLALAACDDNGSNNAPEFADAAVVATRAAGSGAISLIGVDAPYTTQNNLSPSATTDFFVRSGGDHYFVVRRFRTNQVSRYDLANPDTPVYTYSTEATRGEESNPSDLIIVSDTKAYLLRYGSGKLWIVNPSATSEANFKTGEIDLSGYDSFEGVPEMIGGLVKDGKLYVALQRLEFFEAVKNSYVAVIDIATNQEIDTKPDQDGLKGIELPTRNISGLVAVPGTSTIIAVAGGGFFHNDDYTIFRPAYDGGIYSINTGTYTQTLLIDDGDDTSHPYGQFLDFAVVAANRGYFVGQADDFGPSTLYRFNPAGGAPVAVTNYVETDLGSLAVDPSGNLWVGRTAASAPGVSILGFQAGAETTVKDKIGTVQIPMNIDFVTVPLTSP